MTARLPALTLVLCTLPMAAVAQEAGTTTVAEINPQAYTGIWYEVARTPAPFQEQCDGGVTAAYELTSETVMQVVNRCDLANGEAQSVAGEAEVQNGNFNTFDVQLGEAPDDDGINYLVAAVGSVEGDSYSWAAVVSPDDNIGWILSRTPDLEPGDRSEAEAALEEAGVDVSQLSDTRQPPENYDPEE